MSGLSDLARDAIDGPELVGYFLNWGLMGFLVVQIHLYHNLYRHDPLLLQCIAYFLFACECAQTGVLTAGAYYQVVYHSGDAETMEELYHPWCGLMVTCAIASIIVQGFFAWRIYRLSRIRVLVGVIVIMSFAQGACAIVSGFTTTRFRLTSDFLSNPTTHAFIIPWLAGSAAVDIAIALTMTILMIRMKTGTQRTNSLINKIIRLVVETGTLTASVATIELVSMLSLSTFKKTTLFTPGMFILEKLYAITFMANILSRTYLNSHLTLTIHDIVDNVELSLVGHSTIPPSSDMGAGSSTMLPAQTIVSVNVTAASDESTEPKVLLNLPRSSA